MSFSNTPAVSVLMSVYGEPLEWLREAVGSILQQTYTDFEFIIVNDNPEREELDGFLRESATGDRRIHIIRNPENIGLTKSLNIGLRECRGRYVARMDADDVSHSTRFEKQVAYMDAHPDVVVCGTDINYFGDVPVATYSDWIHESDEEIKAQMLSNSGFAHPTVMIRREVLEANSISYDEAYRQGQDYRLWEQLYDFGKFANIGQKLYGYRLSASQVSKKSNTAQVALGLAVRRRITRPRNFVFQKPKQSYNAYNKPRPYSTRNKGEADIINKKKNYCEGGPGACCKAQDYKKMAFKQWNR